MLSFQDVLLECAKDQELIEQYDRLVGSDLSKLGSRSGIDRMIDEATGYDKARGERFAAFVYEVVWCRLPENVTQPAEPREE